jgi:hypothetical protein
MVLLNSSSLFLLRHHQSKQSLKKTSRVFRRKSKNSKRPSLVYSSNENVTIVEVSPANVEVKLSLLYHALEHGFRAAAFHRVCDRKGPTITLVKAVNDPMAAFYNSWNWYNVEPGIFGASTPRGF